LRLLCRFHRSELFCRALVRCWDCVRELKFHPAKKKEKIEFPFLRNRLAFVRSLRHWVGCVPIPLSCLLASPARIPPAFSSPVAVVGVVFLQVLMILCWW